MSDDGGESLSRSGSDVALELHRSGSPTSTLSGPTSTFLVSSYNNKAVLAHTPSGDPQGAGVYTVALDGGSGRLRLLGDSPVADNPAFVLPHPALEDVIYVSTERIDADGEVLAFVREPNETGALRLLSRRSSGGRSTCFLHVHPSLRYLICVSYWDAKVSVLGLAFDGSLLPGEPTVMQQPLAEAFFAARAGLGATREEHWAFRQRWPHSHCVVQEPYTQQGRLFITDLGLDLCGIYELDADTGRLCLQQQVQLDKGRGPRHLRFHPRVRVAYVVNELDSTVSVLSFVAKAEDVAPASAVEPAVATVCTHSPDAMLQHVQTLSSLPLEAQGKSVISPEGIWKAASHSSELRLRPDGRFLYVGNRGHDSIAVYQVMEEQGGLLRLAGIVDAGGSCPRNFNFSRCGSYCVVGCQNSSMLVSFAVDQQTGLLTPCDTLDLPSPNYICVV